MKIKSLIAGLLLSSVAASASVTLSGTSIFSSAINGLTTGVFVVSDSNSFDESLFNFSGALAADTSFALGTSIGNYTVLGGLSINPAGSNSVLGSGITYNLTGNIAQGNEIGVLTFASSTTSATAGDTYSLFTGDWYVPADGANATLTGGGPYGGAAVGAGSVAVPEPSTYATLAGLLALSFVMLRRRG